MKLKNTSVYLLAGWMLAACSGGGFQKTENGVVVEVKQQQPTDVRKVRLEVMGEKLIHVSATPEKEFSKEQSLIVIPQQNKTDFKVEEQGDEVTVKTSELCAIVSKTTGEVRFTDADGKQILAEDSDGRTFTPVEVEGTKGYTVRQVFQSASAPLISAAEQRRLLSMAWASTRRMSSTIKVRMRNCSSTIQRCLYPSSCLIKTTVCFGTAIRSAVSVTRVTTHNWVMSSNFMIKRARKVL